MNASASEREVAVAAVGLLGTFNEWATTFSQDEVHADLVRALSYFSAQQVPDYSTFLSVFPQILKPLTEQLQVETLISFAKELRFQFEDPLAEQVGYRAYKMFKLLISFCTTYLDDSVCKAIFGFEPPPSARAHFQSTLRASADSRGHWTSAWPA